jgi:hypothetical protein
MICLLFFLFGQFYSKLTHLKLILINLRIDWGGRLLLKVVVQQEVKVADIYLLGGMLEVGNFEN